MSNKLPSEEMYKSHSAAQNYRVKNQGDIIKRIIIEKDGDEIFDCDLHVIVENCGIYYEVDIFWEDVCFDFRANGLYGKYSSTYNMMRYEDGELSINCGDIIIRII